VRIDVRDISIIGIGALLLTTAGTGAIAQNPLSFAVASVKPSSSVGGSWRIGCVAGAGPQSGISPGTCVAVSASLRHIIATAYDLPFFTADQHISGGPSWIAAERYDIEAKAEDASATGAELRLMLQNLLADRFKLKLHEETKDVSGYALVVAKGGPKDRPLPRKAAPTPMACGGSTTAALVNCLSLRLGQPVVDKTGITGNHDFGLTLESLGENQPATPSIFTVLEEQLGLKLESQKVTSRMLIIDHAEKPGEN
jgi:uncharacterized protein (TIGR03435 family)